MFHFALKMRVFGYGFTWYSKVIFGEVTAFSGTAFHSPTAVSALEIQMSLVGQLPSTSVSAYFYFTVSCKV